MKKRMLLLGVVLMVAGLWSSAALALTTMGPPMAGLKQGQSGVGFDFSYSEMDVEVSGLGISETLDDVESFAYLVNLSYGITDNWEAFIRLGLTDVEFEEFDGSSEFAYGFGTKVTFEQKDAVTWGGLFQMTWAKSDDSLTGYVPGYGIVTADIEIDFYEIQIAVGPTYELNDTTSIYGGPFLHFINGDLDVSVLGVTGSLDVEQESVLGGYIGLTTEIAENTDLNLEFLFTGDAQAVGLRLVHKF